MGDLETGVWSKIKGKTAIISNRRGGGKAALMGGMYAKAGEQVILRNNDPCGYVTTGQTSDKYSNGEQGFSGMDPGKSECTTDPGDNVQIDCPGPDGRNNNTECPGEPPADENCIRPLGMVYSGAHGCRAAPVGGNAGGDYYLIDLRNNPLIVYPTLGPKLYFDVSVGQEPSYSRAWLKDACGDAGTARGTKVCKKEGGCTNKCDLECEAAAEFCCWDCSCLGWEGAIWRPACRDQVTPGTDNTDIWDKFQFWYPKGALWIWLLCGTDLSDNSMATDNRDYNHYKDSSGYILPGADSATSGWFWVDGKTHYSIVNAPQFAFGVGDDDKLEDYDHTKGGNNTGLTDYNQCMDSLKATGMSEADAKALCDQIKDTINDNKTEEGWSDCMKRLHDQNPSLTEEELATMCNNHPTWTTCMINTFYESGGTLSEDELAEACTGDGDAYTYMYNIGTASGRTEPYPVYAIMLYVGGTSTCPWGWPCIQLWNSEPSSSIGNVRACEVTESEIEEFYEMTDTVTARSPYNIPK